MPRKHKPPPVLKRVSIQGPPQKNAPPPHDPHGPFMPHPLEGAGFFARLEKANTIEEWNEEMADLVVFLIRCATPQGANHAAMVLWAESIRAAIARGLKTPSAHRQKKNLRAHADADFLSRWFGDDIRKVTLTDAVEALRRHENTPPDKNIRARVAGAGKVLGFEFKKGRRAKAS
jgi:hypothetical protein